MNRDDRQAIEGLFTRLRDVEGRVGPRDAEAEAFIRSAIAGQPGAPYYMAQTILVQEQALARAGERIAELERDGAGRGGFLSGLFGGAPARDDGRQAPGQRRAWRDQPQAQGGGGGFLAGAAQTAVGVAGGVLLGNMLAGALFGGPAEASPADAGSNDADTNSDSDFADADSGGGDFGGDFGGGDF
jgi:hypothetical protein